MGKSFSVHNKWISITFHAIGWAIIIFIPLYLNSTFGGGNLRHIYEFYLNAFSYALIFYLGYLWLVPRFFVQRKFLIYIAILLGLIISTYFVSNFIEREFLYNPIDRERFRAAMKTFTGKDVPYRGPNAFGFISHFFSSLLLSGFAVGLGLMDKLRQNEKKQKELEKEKLNSELAFLKNQVSPHFFFNTLNNIYSLIGIDGPTAQESVLKLSKLMRYLLYESEHGETQMSHEIEFMNNYIDLMKLRLSPKVKLQIDFPQDFSDFPIAPLLFVPFIENAFKHGVSYREHSFIHIRMKINQDQIIFISENSIGKSTQNQTEDIQHSGIGLENVKKRLALLFQGRHELKIKNAETVFRVELTIQKTPI